MNKVECSKTYCPYNWFCCREKYIPIIAPDAIRIQCENWDKETHECKIYEERPQECHDAFCYDFQTTNIFRFKKMKEDFNQVSKYTHFIWLMMRGIHKVMNYEEVEKCRRETKKVIQYNTIFAAGLTTLWTIITMLGDPSVLLGGLIFFIILNVGLLLMEIYIRRRVIKKRQLEFTYSYHDKPNPWKCNDGTCA